MGIVLGSCYLVFEWCCDEIGDWCIILYFFYGRWVYEFWVVVIVGWIYVLWGVDVLVVVSDDGIVVCIFDIDGKLFDVVIFLFELEKLL